MIQNAVKVLPDGPYVMSVHRHDYVSFETMFGTRFLDGGNDYRRTNLEPWNRGVSYEDYYLDEESSAEEVMEKLLWGTRGKSGTEPLRYLPISSLTPDHIQAILDTQLMISPLYRKVLKDHLALKRAACQAEADKSTDQASPPA